LYPSAVPSEMQARANGECSRTMEGFLRMSGNMLASIGEMASWTNVLKKNKAVVEDEKPAEADDRQPVNQQ